MKQARMTKAVLTPDGAVTIEQPDGTHSPAVVGTDWDRVESLSDADIDAAAQAYPDSQPLDDAFWQKAGVVFSPRVPKRHQGMRLDAEVIDWFKAQGPGWQTRMNAVLKSYVETQKRLRP